MRTRGTAAIVASPVLVGAVTVLIATIAVFIAYSANKGLPFVPTYDVNADLPSGAKLVPGNEVRVGGFRVGVVDDIKPATVQVKGEPTAVARVELKLDKTVDPLAVDSRVRVRPRSALGLKYIELTPGRSARKLAPGATLALHSASSPLDLEDVFSTFRPRTRRDSQLATAGFGDAFAGRGASINTAIQDLNPFFAHLTPVMRNLADPGTGLDRLFVELGRTSAQVAPVAVQNARLFTTMADTFAAISRDPRALQLTIERSPPTLDAAIDSFAVQRPFLADFTDLSRRLRPAVRHLRTSLPAVNSALAAGIPVLPRTVGFNDRLRGALGQLNTLFADPITLLTLRDLHDALDVSRPALEFLTPYQTVCNYPVYWFQALGTDQAQPSPEGAGTMQAQNAKNANAGQDNTEAFTGSSRPPDVPPDRDPRGAKDAQGNDLHRLYDPNYMPAVDAQGNADCQQGQTGYIKGPLAPGFRYGPGRLRDGTLTGGNWPVNQPDFPGLAGGTYVTRRLGIDNVRDVP